MRDSGGAEWKTAEWGHLQEHQKPSRGRNAPLLPSPQYYVVLWTFSGGQDQQPWLQAKASAKKSSATEKALGQLLGAIQRRGPAARENRGSGSAVSQYSDETKQRNVPRNWASLARGLFQHAAGGTLRIHTDSSVRTWLWG
jgi:hypothetical protein